MRQVRTIAAMTFRLVFRGGTGWGVLAALAAAVAGIFLFARGDETLAGELQLRLHYALSFASVLLTLCILFLACLTIRRDLDDKVMHVLTSYPLKRWKLWLGKWLGLVLFALAGWTVAIVSAAGMAGLYYAAWKPSDGPRDLPRKTWRHYREILPQQARMAELVEREYQRRRRQAMLTADGSEAAVRRALRDDVRRQEQLLAPGEEKTWRFDLGAIDPAGPDLMLEYMLFAREQHQLITATWTVQAVSGPGSVAVEVTTYPYTQGRLQIPAAGLPPDGQVTVTFKGNNAPHLIFPYGRSVKLLRDAGPWWTNLLASTLCMMLHFGAVLLLGMTAATMLTFPVASFAALTAYIVALASGFFSGVAADLAEEHATVLRSLSVGAVKLGLWLSTGLRPPAVLNALCNGRSALSGVVVGQWVPGLVLFAVLCLASGLWSFNRKEIDSLL